VTTQLQLINIIIIIITTNKIHKYNKIHIRGPAVIVKHFKMYLRASAVRYHDVQVFELNQGPSKVVCLARWVVCMLWNCLFERGPL